MAPGDQSELTQLFARLRAGDGAAGAEIAPLVYTELRDLAGAVFARQNGAHTLQPTALVHEAWLKLAGNLESINDRRHFFVLAGRAMRQVLTDHARGRLSQKRGGGAPRVTLDAGLVGAKRSALDLVELDDALRGLAARNERHAQIAELRLFSGLSIEETAEALELSPRTVDSGWAMASAWLRRELGSSER